MTIFMLQIQLFPSGLYPYQEVKYLKSIYANELL